MMDAMRGRWAIVILAGAWLALFAAQRIVRPEPGLRISEYRHGQQEPVGVRFGSVPLEQSLTETERRLGDGFEIRYSGWIRIRHAGVYHASIQSDPESVVTLDLDEQPFAGVNAGRRYTVQVFRSLDPGLKKIDLWYRHGAAPRGAPAAERADPTLMVTWSKGIAVAHPIPADAVFRPTSSMAQFRLSAGLRAGLWILAAAIVYTLLLTLAGPATTRAFTIRLAAVAGGLLLSMVIAEIGLRALGIEKREYVPGSIWLTYRYPRPNTTTQYVGYMPYLVKEFEVPVHINSRGWRDHEVAYAKPPGAYRIVVVGDSYVEGKEVRLEDTFPKRLEARLNAELARPGRRFEVIPLARGGIATDMELRVIRERAKRYSPDVVVLAFFAGNDVRGNVPELEQAYNRWANDVYATKVVPERIACTDSLTWLDSSRLNNVLTARLCDLYIANLYRFRPDLDAEDMVSPDGAVFRGEYDAQWTAAWRRSEALIRASKRATEQMGASFLMLLVHSSQLAGVTGGGLATDTDEFDIDRPRARLLAFCESAAIDCLDLRPPLEQFAADTGLPYCWQYDAHWNENGHRVTADAIFERLSARFSGR